MSGIYTFDDLRERCRMLPSTHATRSSDCWEWIGARSRAGCPSLWSPVLRRVGSVGTLASVIKTGEAAPKDRVYKVFCETAHCCNPDHRRWMSKGDCTRKIHTGKTMDLMHKARITAKKRMQSHITPEIVAQLRAHPVGESVAGLAAELGVSLSHAGAIKAGRRRQQVSPFASLVGAA